VDLSIPGNPIVKHSAVAKRKRKNLPSSHTFLQSQKQKQKQNRKEMRMIDREEEKHKSFVFGTRNPLLPQRATNQQLAHRMITKTKTKTQPDKAKEMKRTDPRTLPSTLPLPSSRCRATRRPDKLQGTSTPKATQGNDPDCGYQTPVASFTPSLRVSRRAPEQSSTALPSL